MPYLPDTATTANDLKASVVIPTKNAGTLFREVLHAVIGQSTPWAFDVLVMDSGSKDGTDRFAESQGVRVHRFPPDEFGHGRTRNLGASLTGGEWIVFITHDAVPASDSWLRNLVGAAEISPEVAGAFGRHAAHPGSSPFLARELQAHFDGFLQWPQVVAKADDPQRYRTDEGYRQVLHFFSDNNACIRRRVWESIPYPDVEFAEDQIWASRIIEAGYAKAYADDAVVYHSHDFGFTEQLRRSFDEALSWKKLFDYRVCPSLAHLLKQAVLTTWGDWRYAGERGKLWDWRSWVLKSPLSNTGRQIGLYLGQRSEHLPEGLARRISRDQALRGA